VPSKLSTTLLRLYFEGSDAKEIALKTDTPIDEVLFELSQSGVNIQQGDLCRFSSKLRHLGFASLSAYFFSVGPATYKEMASQVGMPVGWVRRYYDMFCALEEDV